MAVLMILICLWYVGILSPFLHYFNFLGGHLQYLNHSRTGTHDVKVAQLGFGPSSLHSPWPKEGLAGETVRVAKEADNLEQIRCYSLPPVQALAWLLIWANEAYPCWMLIDFAFTLHT